jgi:hypothetical protein
MEIMEKISLITANGELSILNRKLTETKMRKQI